MDTKTLEKFAQAARRQLHSAVRARLTRVLQTDSVEIRERAAAVSELQRQIAASSRDAVVERVAYTWFNRFCALRYMDANRYTRIGVVSPAAGATQPELLAEAKQGQIDADLPVDRQRVLDLLAGRIPSADAQQEAYRLLLVAACNQWHDAMPFMFEKIDDYSELLMPDDLLSTASILQATRDALTEEACQDVEVIGWLYQFYISEKKDQVIGSKQAVKAEDIPAATQLFTPHWIVRYLVENSLGRLWLLNRPHSRLADQMDYYIAPEEEVTNFLHVTSPEDLRLCDPAAGSGHILTYAFDLLHAIYAEEGYVASDIPRLILEKNLTGIEIDGRAAALAAFALAMKARARDRRFFRRDNMPQPRITLLQPPLIDRQQLARAEWFRALGGNLLDLPLQEALTHDLGMLRQVDNIGSLLRPQLTAEQIALLRGRIAAADDLLSYGLNRQVLAALDMLEPLARQYHVVVANPPYMGGRSFNAPLKKFAKDEYGRSKSDLFAMFIERNSDLADKRGYVAMITMHSWMFLSSYEKLRERLLKRETIVTMAHLGARAFDTIGGEVVSTTAFVLQRAKQPDHKGAYLRLVDGNSEAEKQAMLKAALPTANHQLTTDNRPLPTHFFRASAADFKKIPGAPIAYWVSDAILNVFAHSSLLGSIANVCQGLATADNNRFLRAWHEVACMSIGIGMRNGKEAQASGRKWFPYNKGGDFRRWYGNQEFVVNWKNDGFEIRNFYDGADRPKSRAQNTDYYFRPALSWSKVTSGGFSLRYFPGGFAFDVAGCSIFVDSIEQRLAILGAMNSPVMSATIAAISPTLNYEVGQISSFPTVADIANPEESEVKLVQALVDIAKEDWDSFETSWDFESLPLVLNNNHSIAEGYQNVRKQSDEMTMQMQKLEVANNIAVIGMYNLTGDLPPEVTVSAITLSRNPAYRYGSSSIDTRQLATLRKRWPQVVAQWPEADIGIEQRLLADTMREFISYAVGCMFGRYSLDKPGLILANQGETVEDYMRIVGSGQLAVGRGEEESWQRPVGRGQLENTATTGNRQLTTDNRPLTTDNRPLTTGNRQLTTDNRPLTTDNRPLTTDNRPLPTFAPDDDNVIPILDGDWFGDDIAERFKRFLRVTFGDANYADNLAFIETAIGRDIRGYFLRDFYDHHVTMYKKRPIYWLFSSPKGSFNALIYMHRYRPETASTVLAYLRDYRSKLQARRAHLETVGVSARATQSDKTSALKEIAGIDKALADIDGYERETLYPLAALQIDIDLDDGVLVNYNRFGEALKKIAGVSGQAIPEWAREGNRV